MDFNSKYKSSEIEELLDKVDTLATVATSGSYDDLENKPTIPDISGKVDKVVGKQLSTEDFTSTLKSKLEGLSNYDDAELSNAVSALRKDFDELVSGDTTTAIKTFNEVIAFLDGVQDTQDLSSIIASIEQQIAGKMDKVTLSAVATSGSYNDLKDRPTIPSAVTENTVSGWGFTKNTGTVTGVKINGSTKNPQNGVVDLGTVVTDVSGKQDKLVSGTNIKTVNGESIVGSGNITISGGGGEQIEEPHVEEVDGHKYIMFANEDIGVGSIKTPMMPNVTYVCTEIVDGVILYNLQLPTENIGKYTLHFVVGTEGGFIDFNSDLFLYYPNGMINTELEPYRLYELSIVTTKLVDSGETYWFYKIVLTKFT